MAAIPPQASTVRKNAIALPDYVPAPAQTATRHNKFYLQDDMTVFRVENCLFRVHRHFLTNNSPIFNSMFSLPLGSMDGSTAEGTCDTNPIYLSGVTVLEFETLLQYFYNSMCDDFSLPQTSWIALLSIAHRYDFSNAYKRAIQEIFHPPDAAQQESQDHAMLLSLGERYDVPKKNLLPSLIALITRPQSLTEDEVARLSAFTVSRLARAREEFAREAGDFRSSRPSSTTPWKVLAADVIKKVVIRFWRNQQDG